MIIEKFIFRNRRDFKAIYKCEFCGATIVEQGYDDAHFHENVIPAMKCKKCGKASGHQTSQPIIPPGIQL